MITVGLPVWNSKMIAWLPMESLCRQVTREKWELVIFEERHEQACGKKFFMSYTDRLYSSGCVNIRYLTAGEQLPLSYKWAELGRQADRLSLMFCICDADNYYDPHMIQDSIDAYRDGYDWLTSREGYFYNILSGKLVKYSLYERPQAKTGIQMTVRTKLMRNLPRQEKHKLLNAWIYNNCRPRNGKNERKHLNTLGTHGYNNISGKRGKMIDNHEFIFFPTEKKLENIVPTDIAKRLKQMKK